MLGFDTLKELDMIHIKSGHSKEWSFLNSQIFPSRNRYSDVIPWDKNRVHLKLNNQELAPGHDYINASHISLVSRESKQEKKYIACQGPKNTNISHIWNMIAHEGGDPTVILMLTPTHEGFIEKCCQYWPDDVQDSFLIQDEYYFHGKVLLLDKYIDTQSGCSVHKIQLDWTDNYTDQINSFPNSKIVYHLLYESWRDFSVPDNIKDTLSLLDLTKSLNTAKGSPLIVHCSAGVGRTGTFITLDFLISYFNEYFNPIPQVESTNLRNGSHNSYYLKKSDKNQTSYNGQNHNDDDNDNDNDNLHKNYDNETHKNPNTSIFSAKNPSSFHDRNDESIYTSDIFDDYVAIKDPVYYIVHKLREQRVSMVYNIDQYKFIYSALEKVYHYMND